MRFGTIGLRVEGVRMIEIANCGRGRGSAVKSAPCYGEAAGPGGSRSLLLDGESDH